MFRLPRKYPNVLFVNNAKDSIAKKANIKNKTVNQYTKKGYKKMEEELIRLEEELNELERSLNELDNQDDNWENLKRWEDNFWQFIKVYKSKYSWCRKEFENIHSLKGDGLSADNEWLIPPKNSVRGYINSYKKLFEKIKSIE